MKVGELIKQLQLYMDDIEVKFFDGVESFEPVEYVAHTIDGSYEVILSKQRLDLAGDGRKPSSPFAAREFPSLTEKK